MSAQGWEQALEAKHGLPLRRIPGKVYVLHYEVPQVVLSVGLEYVASTRGRGHPMPTEGPDGELVVGPQGWVSPPIRHYVGWTQQDKPSRRISAHGPAAFREVVYLEPGTMQDEERIKRNGTCPKCGESLSESLSL